MLFLLNFLTPSRSLTLLSLGKVLCVCAEVLHPLRASGAISRSIPCRAHLPPRILLLQTYASALCAWHRVDSAAFAERNLSPCGPNHCRNQPPPLRARAAADCRAEARDAPGGLPLPARRGSSPSLPLHRPEKLARTSAEPPVFLPPLPVHAACRTALVLSFPPSPILMRWVLRILAAAHAPSQRCPRPNLGPG